MDVQGTWTPLCLPLYSPDANVFAYICYLHKHGTDGGGLASWVPLTLRLSRRVLASASASTVQLLASSL